MALLRRTFGWSLLLTCTAAAEAAPAAPTQAVLVEVSDGSSPEDLSEARAQAGAVSVERLPNLNAEIWRVPIAGTSAALVVGRGSNSTNDADLLRNDYRSLFNTSSTDGTLTAAQTQALTRLQAQPELQQLRVVSLRPGRISNRMLLNGFDSAAGFAESGSLRLNLAPGVVVTAVRRNIRVGSADSFEWIGSITSAAIELSGTDAPPPPAGSVALVVRGDRITGTATVGNEIFSIRPLGEGLHAVAKLDQARLPQEHPPVAVEEFPPSAPSPAADAPPPAAVAAGAGAPVTLSVGVLVTGEAQQMIEEQGTTVDEFLSLAVVESNAGFAFSRIPAGIALAGWRPVTYSQLDWEKAMKALYRTDDGWLDDIHAWRSQIRANVVVMILPQRDYCGLASGFKVPRERAFALVSYSCATGYYSFAHEIGHLLGARHDPDTDPADTPFSWGHGYRYQDHWRTIMAYGGGSCGACPRLNAWANPQVSWNGVPMGTVDRHHDARVVADNIGAFSAY